MPFALIPPPRIDGFTIGPLYVHLYGVIIAIAVLVGVFVTQICWERRGHDGSDIVDLALFAIPAGVVGARLYHVVTDYEAYVDNWRAALVIWEGGLGIWGAIFIGAIVVTFVARKKRLPLATLYASAAPGICVAQALGRWGNYFNQELFGRPTDVPWALKVEIAQRPFSTITQSTYHPTFLYESIGCAVLAAVLFAVFFFRILPERQIFPLYVAGYCFIRFFVEGFRIDATHIVFGLRWNQWVAMGVGFGSLVVFAYGIMRTRTPIRSPLVDK